MSRMLIFRKLQTQRLRNYGNYKDPYELFKILLKVYENFETKYKNVIDKDWARNQDIMSSNFALGMKSVG